MSLLNDNISSFLVSRKEGRAHSIDEFLRLIADEFALTDRIMTDRIAKQSFEICDELEAVRIH